MKYKVIKDLNMFSNDGKIRILPADVTVMVNSFVRIDNLDLKITQEIIDNNPTFFIPYDLQAELTKYLKSKKVSAPSITAKAILPFVDELYNDNINLTQEIINRQNETQPTLSNNDQRVEKLLTYISEQLDTQVINSISEVKSGINELSTLVSSVQNDTSSEQLISAIDYLNQSLLRLNTEPSPSVTNNVTIVNDLDLTKSAKESLEQFIELVYEWKTQVESKINLQLYDVAPFPIAQLIEVQSFLTKE